MDRRLHTATREQPLLEMFVELADDFKAWVTAEIAVVKAQMENNTRKLLTAVILLIMAAVIALAGIVVLAHTLVLVLAPYFGAALAGFTIGALLIILAVAFLLYARSAMDLSSLIPSRLSKVLSSAKARRS
jgi:Putative Actinobacterial Holin-X, holin superfamily III